MQTFCGLVFNSILFSSTVTYTLKMMSLHVILSKEDKDHLIVPIPKLIYLDFKTYGIYGIYYMYI